MTEALPPHRSRLAWTAGLLLLTAGCIGPAAPLSANGIIIGADAVPDALNLDQTIDATTLLAYPLSVTDMSRNTVEGADVWLDVDGAVIDFDGEGDGLYGYEPESVVSGNGTLTYLVGAAYTLHAELDGKLHSVTMIAPSAPGLAAPEPGTHPSGAELTFDLRGQDFDYATYAVLNQSGEVILDGLPDSGADLVVALRQSSGVDTVTVPAGVMVGSSQVYTVAVLAIRKAPKSSFDGFGRFWSEFGIGSYAVVPVLTAP
jgi:hypothetical protein